MSTYFSSDDNLVKALREALRLERQRYVDNEWLIRDLAARAKYARSRRPLLRSRIAQIKRQLKEAEDAQRT